MSSWTPPLAHARAIVHGLTLALCVAFAPACALTAQAGQRPVAAAVDLERLVRQIDDQQARIAALEAQVTGLTAARSTSPPDQATAAPDARYGSMPTDWADWVHVAVGPKPPGHPNALAGLVGQVQHDAMPEGGPQGLESYVWDDHQTGTTRLTTVAPQTVEIAGAGRTSEVRSRGGVLTGPGRVDFWNMYGGGGVTILNPSASIGVLCAVCPNFLPGVKPADEKRGIWIPDADAANFLGAGITVPAVTFTNGWSLRVNGDALELRDAQGAVRVLR